MAETKYGKYIIQTPLVENKYPPYTPKLSFESKDHFPELNFGVRYTYLNQPITMETVHTHDFGQFLCFLGTPQDLKIFDGEAELYLGEEGTKNIINVTSVVYIPKGMVHGPIVWKRVDRPMMFLNCILASQYTRTEQKAESRVTSASGMDAKKYEKYIIKEPYSWNIMPPYGARLYFDSHNYFPETDLGIRYTYLNQALDMEHPHSHPFDQFSCGIGPPEDLSLFDAESESYYGEEGEKHIINSSHVSYMPAGLVHGPVVHKRMNTPLMMINFVFTHQYTRTDQQTGFFNYIELSDQKLTLEEASRILGAAVPQPAYLPKGYKVQEIYAQDSSLRLLISDTEIEKRLMTVGDGTGARDRHFFRCKMEMDIKWHPEGKPDGLDARGEEVTIGRNKGILIYRESHLDLRWLLPPQSTPDKPGQYEMALKASQDNKDELFKIAQSVTGK
jgi:hypothetical protein